ncbi:MAG: TIGR02253 family HAD-type hydrolase [Nanoarchaeota archaeon]|nr:TIGR02253 family HAD-type hydrolase [Nanoarchaeota archaeon]
MIKAILFDLDNTLLDLYKLKQMAIEAAVAAMIDAGLKVSRKKIISEIDKIYREKGIEYQKVFDDLLKRLIGKVDYKILASGISAYRKIKNAHLDPYPTVIPTLTKLLKKGYKLGIISDAPKLQIWTRLCDTKLQHFFDFVISAEDTKKKPSTLPFRYALKELKLKPHEVLMVGDSIEKDIIGAKKIGMKTALARYGKVKEKIVGVKRTKEKIDVKPDFVLTKFEDILKIVEKSL